MIVTDASYWFSWDTLVKMRIALVIITGVSQLILCTIIYKMYCEYSKHEAAVKLREIEAN